MVTQAPAIRGVRIGASRVGAFVALTKPRIIELLLITTIPTMIVAQRGLPSIRLMVVTVVGGTLAAGARSGLRSPRHDWIRLHILRAGAGRVPRGSL